MYYLKSIYASRSICAFLLDAVCLLIACVATYVVFEPEIPLDVYSGMSAGLLVAALAALFFNDAYRPSVLSNGQKTSTAILETMGLGLLGALVLYFGLHVRTDVVPALASIAVIFFPLLLVERLILRLLIGMDRFTTNVIVIGATDLGRRIADGLRDTDTGIRLLGFLSDDPIYEERGLRFAGAPVLGRVHHLEKTLADRRVDYIVVASKDRSEHFPADTLMAAKMHGHRVESGISFLERMTGRVFLRDLRTSYLIFEGRFRNGALFNFIKRVIDIVGASVCLLLALPALLAAAVAIKLDSPGPVLFGQRRLGKDDKPFLMYKLRSMRDKAESETGAVFTSDNDDRVTRVGYLLRRTRLDEIPQFWNVLRGEMSLVGPRAERPEFAEELVDRYRFYAYRTSVKPGISGWAQTRYGYVNNVEAYEEKLALDLYYLKYRSTLLDLTILAQTIKTVLRFRGM